MKKAASLIFAASLVSSSAIAQVTSLEAANPARKGGSQDLDKIVCEVAQTTGTRLGAHKVCKTVLEWQQQRTWHRQGVEEIQRMGTSVGCQEGQSCGG
jgi:hypothetical protein